MAVHNLVSTFVLGFLPPPGVQLLVEDKVVGLHSSEQVEVTLVAYSSRCTTCLLVPKPTPLKMLTFYPLHRFCSNMAHFKGIEALISDPF